MEHSIILMHILTFAFHGLVPPRLTRFSATLTRLFTLSRKLVNIPVLSLPRRWIGCSPNRLWMLWKGTRMVCIAWLKIREGLALSPEAVVTEVSDSRLSRLCVAVVAEKSFTTTKKLSFTRSIFVDPCSNYPMRIRAWLVASAGPLLRKTQIGVLSHAVPWT